MKIEILTERVITEKIVYEVEVDDEQDVLTRTEFYTLTEKFENLFLHNKKIFTQTQVFHEDTEEEIEDIQIYKNNENLWKNIK